MQKKSLNMKWFAPVVLTCLVSANSFAEAACDKRERLWDSNIVPSEHKQLPALEDINILGMITHSLRPKIDYVSDVAPVDWEKPIHKRGVVAKVRFVSNNKHDFTGDFKGNECGLIRLSLTYKPEKRGVAPGLALKFFKDNQLKTSNFSALTSLDSQGQDYNFFKKPFSNVVPLSDKIGAKIVNKIFALYAKFPNYIGVTDLAKIKSDGLVESKPHSPVQLFLVPNKELETPALPKRDFRIDLMKIPAGTKLFDVYALSLESLGGTSWVKKYNPSQEKEHLKNAVHVGTLETQSEFLASEFGDTQLFFKHEAFSDVKY